MKMPEAVTYISTIPTSSLMSPTFPETSKNRKGYH
jgi:hypothetical protein